MQGSPCVGYPMHKTYHSYSKEELQRIYTFDVYQGDKIDSNMKSIAISLEFQDTEKTLTSEDVDKFINQILKRLDFTYQAKLRS